MPLTPQDLFRSTLETQRNRGTGLSTSLVLHVAGLALLVALPAAKLELVGTRRSPLIEPLMQPDIVELVAPPRRAPKPNLTKPPDAPTRARFDIPKRPAAPAPRPLVIAVPAPELVLPPPPARTPRPGRPDIPLPAPAVRTGLLAELADSPPRQDPPRLAVRAGSFSEIPAADDNDDKAPASRVQRLAGFGRLNAASGPDNRPRPPTARVGTFGRAEPARSGNRAASGPVSVGGNFGTAKAEIVLGKPAEVRGGGFSQVRAQKVDTRRAEPKPPSPPIKAVRILEKPRPAYTEQARLLRIEGSVLLEVLFTAAGEVKVLRMVRGLDEGLDRNAVQAARRIRFEPAQLDGRATEARALVTIRFQLAY